MKQVWKYPLAWSPHPIRLELPWGSKIVHVGLGNNDGVEVPCLWAEVDADPAEVIVRTFGLVPTGGEVIGTYLGTVHDQGDVYHIYEAR